MTDTPQERVVAIEQATIDIVRIRLFGSDADAIKERLSTLVRVAVERERDECAKVADTRFDYQKPNIEREQVAGEEIARLIRARGDKQDG